jgi:hypothetical protein
MRFPRRSYIDDVLPSGMRLGSGLFRGIQLSFSLKPDRSGSGARDAAAQPNHHDLRRHADAQRYNAAAKSARHGEV